MRRIKTLKKNYEYKNVLSKGRFYLGKYVTLYIKDNNKNENFVGIAVNTKVGKAVKRNRIKRLIRESYRLNKDKLKQGKDIVFMWNKKNDIENTSFMAIKEDVDFLLDKANMV